MNAPAPVSNAYEFDGYRLDVGQRSLTRQGVAVSITAKPFDALVLLVERAGTVVTREEVSRSLWPSTVVEDNNISQTILALRRALDDTQELPRFIATVPRRGYQFIATVHRASAAPATGVASRPVSLPRHRRRWITVGAATLVASVVVAGLFWRSNADPGPPACAGTKSLEAASWCRQAIDLYRTNGGIGVSLRREVRGAIAERLEEALRRDPAFAEARGWRAHLLLDSLMFDPVPEEGWSQARARLAAGAESDAAEAIRIAPTQLLALVALARLDVYRWRLPQAMQRLEEARRIRPGNAVVEHYIAIVALLQDEAQRAARAAQQALELDPRNPAPYSPLVLALLATGERERAVDAARGMIERAPNAPLAYINLARAESAGDPRALLEAVRLAEQKFDATTLNLRVEAALLYARAGEKDEVTRLIRDFGAATAGLHVDDGLAALAQLALRDYEAARKSLEQAILNRGAGMDPMPLLVIRLNVWADPELEKPAWRELREKLGR